MTLYLEHITKLKKLINDFALSTKNTKVLDIGCCPGGWVQYVLIKVTHIVSWG